MAFGPNKGKASLHFGLKKGLTTNDSHKPLLPAEVKTNLFANRVADVFDRLADFATNLSEAFLNLTSGLIVTPFLFKFTVIDCPAHSFFGSPLCPIKFSFHLVSIW